MLRRRFETKLTNLAKKLLQMIQEEVVYTRMIASTPGYSHSTYYRTVNQLENNGLIKKKGARKYKNTFVITDKGRQLLKQKPTIQTRRTDGFSTVIIFDIPEEKARQRTTFRRYLVHNGYMQLQRSVMISPLQPTEELKELARELKISQHVNILSAKINHFI